MKTISRVKKADDMPNRQMGKVKAVSTVITMLFLLGIIAAISGCGGRSALIGRWEEINEGPYTAAVLEFFPDGNVDFDGLTVEWKVEKGRLALSFIDMTQTVNYSISGSTLTLTDDDGLEMKFKKLEN
jgi:hypothetical protein